MNKRKRVAWQKHRATRKKDRLRRKVERAESASPARRRGGARSSK